MLILQEFAVFRGKSVFATDFERMRWLNVHLDQARLVRIASWGIYRVFALPEASGCYLVQVFRHFINVEES